MPEDVATNSAVDTDTGSTEPGASTSSENLSTDSTSSTVTTTAESSTDAGSTPVETHVAEDAKAPTSAETTNEASPPPEVDYKKRFIGAQKSWEQERAEKVALQQQAAQFQKELADLKRQFQGIQPQEVEKYRQQQAVPVWDESNPNHQQFLELRRVYDYYERNMRAAPDDATRQWLGQQMGQELGAEGTKTLREWQSDVRRQEWERQTNPQAFYRKLIQKEAQPVIQQSLQNVSQTYQSVQTAQQDVQKWMKDTEVATPANIKAVHDLMQTEGVPFTVAAARVERDHYRSMVSGANKAKASAEEKERLLQGNAAGVIARNPQTGKFVDYKAVAKERNLVSERDRIDLLFELDSQGRLGPPR